MALSLIRPVVSMLFSAAHARKRLLLAAFGCLCLTACNTVRGFGQDLSRGGEALAQAATEAQADVEQPAPANANAPIPIERARVAALTNRPGTITHEHFQPGADGNGARYVFDILDDGAAYTVGIDARTGAVLENTPRY